MNRGRRPRNRAIALPKQIPCRALLVHSRRSSFAAPKSLGFLSMLHKTKSRERVQASNESLGT